MKQETNLNSVVEQCHQRLQNGVGVDIGRVCTRYSHFEPALRHRLLGLIGRMNGTVYVKPRETENVAQASSESDQISVAVSQDTMLDEETMHEEFEDSVSIDVLKEPKIRSGVQPTRTAGKRIRRRRKSRLLSIRHAVTLCLGGIMALPTAIVILWWLPEGLRQDPMGIGKAVSQQVEWIVPEEFRQ